MALDRAALVRRLLTCFLAVEVARAPLPLEPEVGPAFLLDRLRFVVEDGVLAVRVLRLVRFVVVDFPIVFFRISLIALFTMPEIKVSITPAIRDSRLSPG